MDMATTRKRKPTKFYKEFSSDNSENDEKENGNRSKKQKLKMKYIKEEECSSGENAVEESVCPYEKMRIEALKKNSEILREIGLDVTAAELASALHTEVLKPKVKKKYTFAPKLDPSQIRKSFRLQGKDPSGKEIEKKLQEDSEKILTIGFNQRKPKGLLSTSSVLKDPENEEICNDFLLKVQPHLSDVGKNCELSMLSLENLKKALQNLKLTENTVMKLVSKKINSMAVHPSESKILVAAGGKYGEIGLCDVFSYEKPLTFSPHSESVTCMTFSRFHNDRLYTTSLDGTTRLLNLEKSAFLDFYASDPELMKNHTQYHAEYSENALFIAHGNGDIAVIDQREGHTPVNWYNCHPRSIRTVQLHPNENQYFVTASGTGEVKLWDSRFLKYKSAKELVLLPHPKSVSSAFLSPSGQYLLTTCADNKLRVFDTSEFAATPQTVVMKVNHNNFTGRWIAPFRAVWHPQRNDVFIVGSMERPRRMDVFGVHGRIIHEFRHEELLTSVLSICAFHPTKLMVFGGNASGKVHVFAEK